VAPEVALSGGIMVDAAGRRFVDETRYPGGLGIKMLDLPGKQAYEIFDERIFQLHRNAPGLRSLGRLFDAGLLLKAETPAELAANWELTPRG
jgi:fumarate reductase flavoprotein subunit